MSNEAHVLVCDDDAVFRMRLARAFRDRGIETSEAGNSAEALGVAAKQRLTHGVVDLRMPGLSGIELIPELISRVPGIRLVLLTGYGSIATTVQALKLGALNYLTKPTDADAILVALGLFCPENPVPQKVSTAVPRLEQVEWEHIQRVVTECEGNITKAAKLLGLHRRSLQRKLQKAPMRLK